MNQTLAAFVAGELPAGVAAMRALAEAGSAAEARVAAAGAGAGTLRPLLTDEAFVLVRRMYAIADHDTPATPEAWAAVFDQAAALSPEASVALYSLGDAQRLAAATTEVAAWLRSAGPVSPGARVLEIGCGIGRFVAALAGEVELYVGLDVSQVMAAQATRRTAELPGAAVVRTGGRDLATFADEAFDVVLAIDSWPYVVNVGLSEALASEAARVLRPGGTFLVLNWSYRGDAGRDRADAAALAARLGLHLTEPIELKLRHWNAVVVQFRRL